MWWEYVIVITCLAAALLYVVMTVRRQLRSRGACGGGACHCGGSGDNQPERADRKPKITPLVQINRSAQSTHGDANQA